MLLTPRNIFIANLSMSNLLLCVVTMPLTLVDLITKYWPLGKNMVGQYSSNLNHDYLTTLLLDFLSS